MKNIEISLGICSGRKPIKLFLKEFSKIEEDLRLLSGLKEYCGHKIEVEKVEMNYMYRYYKVKTTKNVEFEPNCFSKGFFIDGEDIDSEDYKSKDRKWVRD